jgi:hypothetical protein
MAMPPYQRKFSVNPRRNERGIMQAYFQEPTTWTPS